MTESNIDILLEKVSKAKHRYCGILDENGFRINIGCEQWSNDEAFQKYSGQFLYNNLHRKGIYLNDKNGNQSYFDGLYYANKLEGYGKAIYSDNTAFEGLFKEHNRFGPGILTYEDGSQDVGIWDGFSLRRLSASIGENFVPRLGETLAGKAKLFKYRTLVPVCRKGRDVAKEILTELGANENILAQSDHLYNKHVRNPQSVFFNARIYDESFYNNEDCTIEVVLTKEEFEKEATEQQMSEEDENIQEEEEFGFFQKSSSKCACFEPSLDRFGHICVQLEEIEKRLEKIVLKKERMENDLLKCKYCCDHVILPKPDAPNEPPVEANLDHKGDESLEEVEEVSSGRGGSKRKLSFYSSAGVDEQDSPEFHQQRSEIELKSYLYTNNTSESGEDHPIYIPHEKLSRITLPFAQWSGVLSTHIRFSETVIFNQNDRGTEFMGEYEGETEEDVDAIRTLKSCFCNHWQIEDIDVLRDKLKTVRQEEAFFTFVRNNLKHHLDVEFERFNKAANEGVHFIKKVAVTDLVAWNNESYNIMILQHCFRHRLSEPNVTFSIGDLLTGHRHQYNTAGAYEKSCTSFLEACSEGHDKGVFEYIRKRNINPDLCDARGNTGLMLATVRDKITIVHLLANCGAKVDTMNDEGLTPLSLSLLKYISFKCLVSDWEKAFLENVKLGVDDLANIEQWRPTSSALSLVQPPPPTVSIIDFKTPSKSKSNISKYEIEKSDSTLKPANSEFGSNVMVAVLEKKEQEQEYVFNLDYIRMPLPKNKTKKKKKKGRKRKHKKAPKKAKLKTKVPKKQKKKKERKVKTAPVDEEKLEKQLEKIKRTINTILACGSDPNIGEVPLKSIFLSIFTDDSEVVKDLLKNNADPNTTTVDDNLTSLHMIVSLQPTLQKIKMCEILLDYNADPNIKTNPSHWSNLRHEVLGKEADDRDHSDEGKNVLHVLTLREDFINDSDDVFGSIATILVGKGCKTDDFYLGHTPLSLATLRANTKLINALLKTKQVDPHQVLNNKMGNALTILILNRFEANLANDVKIEAAKSLLDNGLNPLHKIGEFENAISFMEHEEYEAKLKKSVKKISKKKKKKQKSSTKSSKKTSKKSSSKKSLKKGSSKTLSKNKKTTSSKRSSKKRKRTRSKSKFQSIQQYIIDASRKILCRHLQGKAVECLYHLITETLVADPLIVVLAKFVTTTEALKCINLLFQSGVINADRFSHVVIYDFLEFVRLQHVSDDAENLFDADQIEETINQLSWKYNEPNTNEVYLPLPEIDRNEEKYTVCFHCLKGEGKHLIACPSCELVNFCSEDCNKKSIKSKTQHYCNVLFYKTVQDILHGEIQPKRLNVLLEMADKMRKERLAIFEMKELNEKILKMNYKSKKLAKDAEEAIKNFKRLEKEKKNFGKANILWDYTKIFMKRDVKKKEKVDGSINQAFIEKHSSYHLAPDIYAAYSTVLRSTGTKVSKNLLNASTRHSFVIGPDLRSYEDPVVRTTSSTKTSPKPGTPVTSTSAVSFVPRPRRRSQFLPKQTRSVKSHELINRRGSDHLAPKVKALRSHKVTSPGRRVKDIPLKDIIKSFKNKNEYLGGNLTKEDQLKAIVKMYKNKNEKMAIKNLYQHIGDDSRKTESDTTQRTSKAENRGKSYYMGLLSKIFADFNLPLLLLPYACYKDGQVYYSMSGNMSYFGSSFHKLQLPN